MWGNIPEVIIVLENMKDCYAWIFQQENLSKDNVWSENYKRKVWKKECGTTQHSSDPNSVWQKIKKRIHFPTTGNWTGCCESVQKRAKRDEKNILCEWRAGRKPDGADGQGADIKRVHYFWLSHLLVIDWTDSKGYMWIRESHIDLLSTSVRKSRCSPIFQPLITLMAHQNKIPSGRASPKKVIFNWRTVY